jgi:hypothetical protein
MTSRTGSERRTSTIWWLLCAAALAGACAGRPRAASDASARPQVLTVGEIVRMAEAGQTVTAIMGEIQATGTVYRLTDAQAAALRASLPATLISFMQLTYVHAVEQNPALARSDEQWTKIEGHWYGGSPFGWPREWVVGGPGFGERLRRR